MVLVLAVARLVAGPVPIDFAQPTLKRELNRQLAGYGIDFDHTVIAWQGWHRGLDILVTNVVLRDGRGLTVVELPELSVGLDAVQLLKGRMSPNRIELLGPTISMSRRVDGSFGFRRDDTAGAASEQVTQGFIAALLAEPTGSAARLKRIGIDNATIIIDDLAQQQDWRVDGATLDARRTDDGLRVTLDGKLTAGERVVGLSIAADYSRFTDRVAVGIRFTGAVPSMLKRQVGALKDLAGIDVPVSGSLLLNAATDGRIDRIEFNLTADRGTLDLGLWPRPMQLDGAIFKAVLDRNAGRLDISKASLSLGGGTIDASAVLASTDAGVAIKANADIDRLPFRTIASFWPESVKPNTRQWFVRNVEAGRVMGGRLDLSVSPRKEGEGSDTEFRFAFGFEGLELYYIRPMPPLSAASGTAVLLPGSFEVRVDKGQIADPKTGMNIRVASVYGLMSHLDQPTTHEADINLAFTSGASDILTLIDYQPLGYASAYGLSPTSIGGKARVRARFRFPLIDKLSIDDVEFRISGLIEGLDIVDAPDFVRQTPGTVAVTVNRSGLQAQGRVFLWDNPADVTWNEHFGAVDEPPTRYSMTVSLPPKRLYALGMPTALELSGPLPFSVSLVGKGINISQGLVSVDLTKPAIGLPLIDWRKKAGEAGSLSMTMATVSGKLRPGSFNVSAPALSARGKFEFDANGGFKAADFRPLKVGDSDVHLTLQMTRPDTIDLGISGRQLDLRPFLGDKADKDETSNLNAVISVDVDRVIGARELTINKVQGVVRLAGNRFDEAQLAGSFPSGETLFIDYHPEGAARSLAVQTDNAGYLVAALDLFDGAVGGRLSLQATVEGTGARRRTVGTLDVRHFNITGAPGLARILTLGSLTGIVDALSGDGLSFDRLQAEFDHAGGELSITKAQAVGSQLGIKMEGRAYDDLSKLDIHGTLAPAYSLNTALNFVPVVGAVLSGGRGEGLFAMRFSVTGPIDDPDVSVNPLSALTPGILRGIFDVFDPPKRRTETPAEPKETTPAPAGTAPSKTAPSESDRQ